MTDLSQHYQRTESQALLGRSAHLSILWSPTPTSSLHHSIATKTHRPMPDSAMREFGQWISHTLLMDRSTAAKRVTVHQADAPWMTPRIKRLLRQRNWAFHSCRKGTLLPKQNSPAQTHQQQTVYSCPVDWKSSFVTPISKTPSLESLNDLRPVAITPIPSLICEDFVFDWAYNITQPHSLVCAGPRHSRTTERQLATVTQSLTTDVSVRRTASKQWKLLESYIPATTCPTKSLACSRP
ncbi:hypothetical protein E2C01_051756 [Portunus trituberculatus]|uniref:Uncharacterized protein n=1 Tax=Portunus trituberculatus TaxID=210409 RepID=A0A5B7GJN4_PORTR|nr:hypothetical protein [Portunus trituberculatus]